MGNIVLFFLDKLAVFGDKPMKFILHWYNYVLVGLGELHSIWLSKKYNIREIYMKVVYI